MPRGFLSARVDANNSLHHLWRNNGCVWWVHYTLHFDHRKRRIRRSLKTSSVDEAIRRRDVLFARIGVEGEDVPERTWEGNLGEESDPPDHGEPRHALAEVTMCLAGVRSEKAHPGLGCGGPA